MFICDQKRLTTSFNFCYISGRNDEIRKLNPSVSQRKSLSHLVAVVKAISQSRMASF